VEQTATAVLLVVVMAVEADLFTAMVETVALEEAMALVVML
jgi:hypothetical protein